MPRGALPFRRPKWEYVVEKRLSIQLVRGDHGQFFQKRRSYQVEERYKGSLLYEKKLSLTKGRQADPHLVEF